MLHLKRGSLEGDEETPCSCWLETKREPALQRMEDRGEIGWELAEHQLHYQLPVFVSVYGTDRQAECDRDELFLWRESWPVGAAEPLVGIKLLRHGVPRVVNEAEGPAGEQWANPVVVEFGRTVTDQFRWLYDTAYRAPEQAHAHAADRGHPHMMHFVVRRAFERPRAEWRNWNEPEWMSDPFEEFDTFVSFNRFHSGAIHQPQPRRLLLAVLEVITRTPDPDEEDWGDERSADNGVTFWPVGSEADLDPLSTEWGWDQVILWEPDEHSHA